jgi:hypothetical protein
VLYGDVIQQDVPAADRAIGRDVVRFWGTGGIFNRDVEAIMRDSVFPVDTVHARASICIPQGNNEAKHTV